MSENTIDNIDVDNGVVEETCCAVKCTNCFFGGRKIGTRGDINSPFMIVGESPGMEELAKGIPFVGASGAILRKEIPDNIDPFITNAIQCFPKNKDEKKLNEACSRCHDRLISEVTAAPRKVILALGNAALRSLTGNYGLKITQERGKLFPSPYASEGIVACVHPAFLLRGGGSVKKFKEDISYAVSLAIGGDHGKKYIEPTFEVVQSLDQATAMVSDLSQYEFIGADIETSGFSFINDKTLSLGLAADPSKVYIIPGVAEKGFFTSIYPKALDNEEVDPAVWSVVKTFLEGDRKFIWHNGKFDIKFLRQASIRARVDEDTLLLNYALDETRGVHDLEQVSMDLLGAPNWKDELEKYLPKKRASYSYIPRNVLNLYLARDVSSTLQIFTRLRPQVAADAALEKLYVRTLIPASEFLANLEMTGFYFDWKQWQLNKDRLEKETSELAADLCEIAGYSLNPNSPAQIAKLLYEDLNIPQHKGAKANSTAKEVVDKLPKVPAVLAPYISLATSLCKERSVEQKISHRASSPDCTANERNSAWL